MLSNRQIRLKEINQYELAQDDIPPNGTGYLLFDKDKRIGGIIYKDNELYISIEQNNSIILRLETDIPIINIESKADIVIESTIQSTSLTINANNIKNNGKLHIKELCDFVTKQYHQTEKANVKVLNSFKLLSKTAEILGSFRVEKSAILLTNKLTLGKEGRKTVIQFSDDHYIRAKQWHTLGNTTVNIKSIFNGGTKNINIADLIHVQSAASLNCAKTTIHAKRLYTQKNSHLALDNVSSQLTDHIILSGNTNIKQGSIQFNQLDNDHGKTNLFKTKLVGNAIHIASLAKLQDSILLAKDSIHLGAEMECSNIKVRSTAISLDVEKAYFYQSWMKSDHLSLSSTELERKHPQINESKLIFKALKVKDNVWMTRSQLIGISPHKNMHTLTGKIKFEHSEFISPSYIYQTKSSEVSYIDQTIISAAKISNLGKQTLSHSQMTVNKLIQEGAALESEHSNLYFNQVFNKNTVTQLNNKTLFTAIEFHDDGSIMVNNQSQLHSKHFTLEKKGELKNNNSSISTRKSILTGKVSNQSGSFTSEDMEIYNQFSAYGNSKISARNKLIIHHNGAITLEKFSSVLSGHIQQHGKLKIEDSSITAATYHSTLHSETELKGKAVVKADKLIREGQTHLISTKSGDVTHTPSMTAKETHISSTHHFSGDNVQLFSKQVNHAGTALLSGTFQFKGKSLINQGWIAAKDSISIAADWGVLNSLFSGLLSKNINIVGNTINLGCMFGVRLTQHGFLYFDFGLVSAFQTIYNNFYSFNKGYKIWNPLGNFSNLDIQNILKSLATVTYPDQAEMVNKLMIASDINKSMQPFYSFAANPDLRKSVINKIKQLRLKDIPQLIKEDIVWSDIIPQINQIKDTAVSLYLDKTSKKEIKKTNTPTPKVTWNDVGKELSISLSGGYENRSLVIHQYGKIHFNNITIKTLSYYNANAANAYLSLSVKAKRIVNDGNLLTPGPYFIKSDIQAKDLIDNGFLQLQNGSLKLETLSGTGKYRFDNMKIKGDIFNLIDHLSSHQSTMDFNIKIDFTKGSKAEIKDSNFLSPIISDKSTLTNQGVSRFESKHFEHDGIYNSNQEDNTLFVKTDTISLKGNGKLSRQAIEAAQFPDAVKFILAKGDYSQYQIDTQLGVKIPESIRIIETPNRTCGLTLQGDEAIFYAPYITKHDFTLISTKNDASVLDSVSANNITISSARNSYINTLLKAEGAMTLSGAGKFYNIGGKIKAENTLEITYGSVYVVTPLVCHPETVFAGEIWKSFGNNQYNILAGRFVVKMGNDGSIQGNGGTTITATQGNIENHSGTIGDSHHLALNANMHIIGMGGEKLEQMKFSSAKKYVPAVFYGGLDDKGMGIEANATHGKIISDVANWNSIGDNRLEAKEGVEFKSRSNDYISDIKEETHRAKILGIKTFKDGHDIIIKTSTIHGLSTLRSEIGKNTIISKNAPVNTSATIFIAPKGTDIEGTTVNLDGLITQEKTTRQKVRLFGLENETIKNKTQISTPTIFITENEGTNRIVATTSNVNAKSAEFFGGRLDCKAAETLYFSRPILQNSIRSTQYGVSISSPWINIIKNFAESKNIWDAIKDNNPTLNKFRKVLESNNFIEFLANTWNANLNLVMLFNAFQDRENFKNNLLSQHQLADKNGFNPGVTLTASKAKHNYHFETVGRGGFDCKSARFEAKEVIFDNGYRGKVKENIEFDTLKITERGAALHSTDKTISANISLGVNVLGGTPNVGIGGSYHKTTETNYVPAIIEAGGDIIYKKPGTIVTLENAEKIANSYYGQNIKFVLKENQKESKTEAYSMHLSTSGDVGFYVGGGKDKVSSSHVTRVHAHDGFDPNKITMEVVSLEGASSLSTTGDNQATITYLSGTPKKDSRQYAGFGFNCNVGDFSSNANLNSESKSTAIKLLGLTIDYRNKTIDQRPTLTGSTGINPHITNLTGKIAFRHSGEKIENDTDVHINLDIPIIKKPKTVEQDQKRSKPAPDDLTKIMEDTINSVFNMPGIDALLPEIDNTPINRSPEWKPAGRDLHYVLYHAPLFDIIEAINHNKTMASTHINHPIINNYKYMLDSMLHWLSTPIPAFIKANQLMHEVDEMWRIKDVGDEMNKSFWHAFHRTNARYMWNVDSPRPQNLPETYFAATMQVALLFAQYGLSKLATPISKLTNEMIHKAKILNGLNIISKGHQFSYNPGRTYNLYNFGKINFHAPSNKVARRFLYNLEKTPLAAGEYVQNVSGLDIFVNETGPHFLIQGNKPSLGISLNPHAHRMPLSSNSFYYPFTKAQRSYVSEFIKSMDPKEALKLINNALTSPTVPPGNINAACQSIKLNIVTSEVDACLESLISNYREGLLQPKKLSNGVEVLIQPGTFTTSMEKLISSLMVNELNAMAFAAIKEAQKWNEIFIAGIERESIAPKQSRIVYMQNPTHVIFIMPTVLKNDLNGIHTQLKYVDIISSGLLYIKYGSPFYNQYNLIEYQNLIHDFRLEVENVRKNLRTDSFSRGQIHIMNLVGDTLLAYPDEMLQLETGAILPSQGIEVMSLVRKSLHLVGFAETQMLFPNTLKKVIEESLQMLKHTQGRIINRMLRESKKILLNKYIDQIAKHIEIYLEKHELLHLVCHPTLLDTVSQEFTAELIDIVTQNHLDLLKLLIENERDITKYDAFFNSILKEFNIKWLKNGPKISSTLTADLNTNPIKNAPSAVFYKDNSPTSTTSAYESKSKPSSVGMFSSSYHLSPTQSTEKELAKLITDSNLLLADSKETPEYMISIDLLTNVELLTNIDSDKRIIAIQKDKQSHIDYDLLRGELAKMKSLPSDTSVVQVAGDSSPLGNEGSLEETTFCFDYLNDEFTKDSGSMILTGTTGNVSKDQRMDPNQIVNLLNLTHENRLIGNLVNGGSLTALDQWKCLAPQIDTFVMVHTKEGAQFRDDVIVSDSLTNKKLYLLEGGEQSFRQAVNVLTRGVPVDAIYNVRGDKNPSTYCKETKAHVNLFSAAEFLVTLKEHVIHNEFTVQSISQCKDHYLETHPLSRPGDKAASEKIRLFDETWGDFIKDGLKHLDKIKPVRYDGPELQHLPIKRPGK